ncbi:hypothetical protein [Candidatus Contubernalis alkaliaceticus]|uniref:hypothetical protein n=1 Tax=Candidatus Contubernalis alkaliaceticus TaxID=338645 RepID=UPI001F4C06A0|nr:hypothetical protein [Candidatus Contubernalis alkalaceticus]UNC92398.1 hypothetical protein HUE98_09980 [Candidatus Contubernalis alkalaceticus]
MAIVDSVLDTGDTTGRELIKHRYIDGETEYMTYQKMNITRDEYLDLKQTAKKSVIEPLAEAFTAYLGINIILRATRRLHHSGPFY